MARPLLVFAAVLVTLLALAPPAQASWTWPLRGEVITYFRNGDDPYASGQHRGIDIAGEVGAAVVAAAGGEVRFAGTVGSSGLTVSVRTTDGFDTSYLHLSSTSVRAGERIAPGERLGAVGTTGTRSASEPHLHFGVREAGSEHAYRDPLDFLPPPPVAPREGPDPTPTPAPQPVPLAPAPGPAPAPAERRVPAGRRVPAPRGAPAPRRAPVPRGAPAPRRAPIPRGSPAPQRTPVPHAAPGPRTAPTPSPGAVRHDLAVPRTRAVPQRAPSPIGHGVGAGQRAPGDVSGLAPDGRRAPAGARNAAASDAAPGQASAEASAATGTRPLSATRGSATTPGPDHGMLIACAGLLLAAALVGGTDDGRKAARSAGGRAARLLCPLLGRG